MAAKPPSEGGDSTQQRGDDPHTLDVMSHTHTHTLGVRHRHTHVHTLGVSTHTSDDINTEGSDVTLMLEGHR